jgi:hypothetical protein
MMAGSPGMLGSASGRFFPLVSSYTYSGTPRGEGLAPDRRGWELVGCLCQGASKVYTAGDIFQVDVLRRPFS